MTNSNAIRRKLLTFALINQNFSGKVDPVTALFPLFAPIASDNAGQRFKPEDFQLEMRTRYGMSLSRDVVDLFVQRLRQLGLVEGGKDKAVWNASTIPAHNAKDDVELGMIDRVLARAQEFAAERKDLLTYEIDDNVLLQTIMEVVLGAQSVLQSAVDAVSASEGEGKVSTLSGRMRSADQYFASNLISWLRDRDAELFTWVAGLSGAAMVAEALVEIRSPSLPARVSADLTVYLDTPFLMELLGCSGSAARSDARYITDSLCSHGVKLAVLAHSIDELRYNLKAVLKSDPRSRTGPSAAALLFQEVSEAFLKHVLEDPEYYISLADINIVDIKTSAHLINLSSFSDEDEHSFFSNIQSYYNHPEAALRDAASVSWVMRRRRGEQARDVLKAKHVLLTRNVLIYRVINKFCLDRGYVRQGTVGPVVLARDLAGVLWLISGSEERIEISKKQLIMNCQRAKNNAPETINSIVRTLEGVSKESADLFWLAVQKPSYLSLALDTVAGAGTGITEKVAEDTLDKIRDDLVADERSKARENLRKAKEQFERDAALQEIVISTLKSEQARAEGDRDNLVKSWSHFASSQWDVMAKGARQQIVLSQSFLVFSLVALSVIAAYIGSDLMNADPALEFWVSSLLVVAMLILSANLPRRLLEVWSERRFQKKYAAVIEGNVPFSIRDDVQKHTKMLRDKFLDNLREAFTP